MNTELPLSILRRACVSPPHSFFRLGQAAHAGHRRRSAHGYGRQEAINAQAMGSRPIMATNRPSSSVLVAGPAKSIKSVLWRWRGAGMMRAKSAKAFKAITLVSFAALSLICLQPTSAHTEEITVFVAVSLTNAVTDIARRFEEDTGDKVRLSFNATSNLAKQIESGAPADIFISADQEWMDYLSQKGLVDKATRAAVFGNTISLIAASSDPISLEIKPNFPLFDGLKGGRLAVGDPDHTAVGGYAKASLIQLGVWEQVDKHLAKAASVRAGLTMVERGEAKMGIVFTTEAKISNKVRIIGEFPTDTHPAIVYPMAIVVNSTHVAASKKFISYLSGNPRAREVLVKYGFISLEAKAQ